MKRKKKLRTADTDINTFSRFIYFKMNGTTNFTEIREIATFLG